MLCARGLVRELGALSCPMLAEPGRSCLGLALGLGLGLGRLPRSCSRRLLLRSRRRAVLLPPLGPPSRKVLGLPGCGELPEHRHPPTVAVRHVVDTGILVVLDCLPAIWLCVMPAWIYTKVCKVDQEEGVQAPVDHVMLPHLLEGNKSRPVLLGILVAEVLQEPPVVLLQPVGEVAAREAVEEAGGVVFLPEAAPIDETGFHLAVLVTPEERVVYVHVLVCQADQIPVVLVQERVELLLAAFDVK
mmetsp:Transcript_74048/g.224466  ORF Transcript_74048/g.224466 Transcript_74048/m.224466 type:complete len:245 (-) Transcript_74048:1330-2064(-)